MFNSLDPLKTSSHSMEEMSHLAQNMVRKNRDGKKSKRAMISERCEKNRSVLHRRHFAMGKCRKADQPGSPSIKTQEPLVASLLLVAMPFAPSSRSVRRTVAPPVLRDLIGVACLGPFFCA